MFSKLFNQSKEYGKNALNSVKKQAISDGKSQAQEMREKLIREADHANFKKKIYKK